MNEEFLRLLLSKRDEIKALLAAPVREPTPQNLDAERETIRILAALKKG